MPRISSLPTLGMCPGFALLRALPVNNGSSPAANTGTAIGRLTELWHRHGESPAAMISAWAQTLTEQASDFPQADMDYVQKCGLQYANDPRNHGVVIAEHCELEVTVSLAPAPGDPTGLPVELVGHVDQIRRDAYGNLRVWDMKNGVDPGLTHLYKHAWQLAAYAVAATETLGEPVLPGGIIRTQGYVFKTRKKQPEPGEAKVFFPAPWTLEQCGAMLGNVLQHISLDRQGIVLCQPGKHCDWCPADGPHACASQIQRDLKTNE